MVCLKRSAAGEVALDCEVMTSDLPSQDLVEGDFSPELLSRADPVRVVMTGVALELLAALSRCNGRVRRKEFCLERRDNWRLARRGGGIS